MLRRNLSTAVLAFVFVALSYGMLLAEILCKKCDKSNPDSARYCMYCGTFLGPDNILFEDNGSGSHTSLDYEINLNSGAFINSVQLEGSNYARILNKTGPDGMNIGKFENTDLQGLRLQCRVKFETSWDSEPSMSKGYAFCTMEIDFRASKDQGLVTYAFVAYKSHPFANSMFAGTPKDLERILSTQRNLGYSRVSEGVWHDFDIDLTSLLRENFTSVSPQDVHNVKVTFAIQNWPQEMLEDCNGKTTIDYIRLVRGSER